MLTGRRQNFHHSKLPQPGEMGYIVTGQDRFGGPRYYCGRRRKCIVESFPLTDSPDYRYSIGIHTVTVRFLDNQERWRCSGANFQPLVC
jgi:hypothetical protein